MEETNNKPKSGVKLIIVGAIIMIVPFILCIAINYPEPLNTIVMHIVPVIMGSGAGLILKEAKILNAIKKEQKVGSVSS